MKRLVIVADHSFVVHAIRLALRQTAGFQVVGFIDGRSPAATRCTELRPDVVLVDDMQLPENAIARLREAAEHAPDAKRLLLTHAHGRGVARRGLRGRRRRRLSKSVHPVTHGHAAARDLAGQRRPALPSEPPGRQRRGLPADRPRAGDPRLAAEGYTNSRIARELWVTEQTVKFHLSNTYRKLGVANRTEATRYAYMHDLVLPHERLAS